MLGMLRARYQAAADVLLVGVPQEAMHAEAHMLVDTSYGSLLVCIVSNVALSCSCTFTVQPLLLLH